MESKVRKYEHNNSAINLNYGLNKSELSMDKGNVTSYNMGEKKASEEKELKITNSQMIEETNRFRSDIPMISSKTEKYKV